MEVYKIWVCNKQAKEKELQHRISHIDQSQTLILIWFDYEKGLYNNGIVGHWESGLSTCGKGEGRGTPIYHFGTTRPMMNYNQHPG